MDLGKAKLKRCGINSLISASHSQHGLAWTDGKAVFMSPISIVDNELQNRASRLLGSFELVHSVSWCNSSNSLLAIVHDTAVSIWKVEDVTPQLTFRQVRKINISAIPQGCLWNPVKEILCVLTLHQCCLYFRHLSDKGSFVLPNIDSNVTCGCWSEDGLKLVIGVGLLVLIYEWRDIDKMVTDYNMNAWKIPNTNGRICSLASISSFQFVAATELPLDRLCHSNSTTDLPDSNDYETTSSHSDCNGYSGFDLLSSTSGYPAFHHLLNVRENFQCGSRRECSQLVVFEVRDVIKTDSLRKLTSVSLPRLICPDLLFVNTQGRQIIVGSNAYHSLDVFSFVDMQLLLVNELNLASDERPKGLSRHPVDSSSHAVLVMVGQLQETSPLFVPSSTSCEYQLSLQLVSTIPDGQKKADNFKKSSFEKSSLQSLDKMARNSFLDGDSPPLLSANGASKAVNDLNEMTENDVRKSCSTNGGSPGPLIQCQGEEESVDYNIETEYTFFRTVQPKFENLFIGKGDKRPLLMDEFEGNEETASSRQRTKLSAATLASGFVNRFKAKTLINNDKMTHSVASKKSVAFVHDEVSADDGSSLQQHLNCHRSAESLVTDLSSRIESFQAQLASHGRQMADIQLKIDQILSEMSSRDVAGQTQRRCFPDADVLHVVDSNGLQKVFLLDNGKLQLEVLKQAFGLSLIELLINETYCVVGADQLGYIPMHFVSGQTIYISGSAVIGAFRI